MNITDPIRHRARLQPDAVAIIRADDTPVSYRDFDRMIDGVVARVAGLGLVAGQTVGLAITGPDEFPPLVIALALARAGIASADLALPAERMHLLLAGPGSARPDGVRAVSFDESWVSASTRGRIPQIPIYQDGSAICRIFASSGTTGTQKLAAISHDLLSWRVLCNLMWLGPAEPVHICGLGFGGTWGLTTVLQTLWSGAALVLTNPAAAVAAIRRHNVKSITLSPVALTMLLEAVPDSLPRLPLTTVATGGSLLPPRLYDLARRKLCDRVVTHYGATEMGGVATASVALLQGLDTAVGFVHSGVEAQAVDADDRPLQAGSEGILRIRSQGNVSGYLDAAETASAFKDGWFYPGDVGTVTADGILMVTGRVGDFINAGGIKINPKLIEDALLTLPEVTEAVAFGVPDSMGVQQVWAAIVAGQAIPGTLLTQLCREKLGSIAPKFILQVDRLPRNASGKVMREELVRLAMAQPR